MILTLSLGALNATYADSATWSLNPISNDWNTAENWTPNTVPNSLTDVATFNTSAVTEVTLTTDFPVNYLATLQFNPGELADGDGPYAIYLLTKANAATDPTETDSGDSVLLSVQPYVSGIQNSIDRSKVTADHNITLALNGKHLDKIDKVSIVDESNASNSVQEVGKPHDTVSVPGQLTVAFDLTKLTATSYHLRYTIVGISGKVFDPKSVTISVSGAVPPAAVAPGVVLPAKAGGTAKRP